MSRGVFQCLHGIFNTPIIFQLVLIFFGIYWPMHRTDLFIASVAHLDYSKKYFQNFMVNDAVLEYIYITETKYKMRNK